MNIVRRLLWGARHGALFGVVFCGLALVAFLIGGHATFEAQHTSLGRVLVLYLVGGVASGIIIGALRPLTARPIGAGAVGFLCGLLFGVLLRIARDGLNDWGGRDAFLVLSIAVALGIPVGLVYRDIFATPAGSQRGDEPPAV